MADVPVIIARRGCGCISMAHAMGPGFTGSQRERDFRREAEHRNCDVIVVPRGQSMKKYDQCDGNCVITITPRFW
jgi:hypothetical protein